MISEIIEKWIKGILIDGITGNLSGLFDNVNAKVGEIASDVGSTPQAWNSGIFNMLRSLSETVVLPIAAAILALVMCHELIQMITEKNNMHDFDTSMFFRWIFKSAFAILIVSNTWNIVMGVFDATQSVVNQSSGVIIGETSIHFDRLIPGLEFQLESMTIGSLLSLWFQTLVVGLTMNILSICIFLVTYGRMIEIYVVTALGPIPLATMGSSEWRSTGQNYLKSLLALGFQAFLIMIVVGIHSMAGDAGKMLSGGQRQRISLARAILKDAPIVVLDEATAYADPENEEKMEAAIAELVKGKTLVVIAHKLPAIMNADQICVIDHGKLVAAGKHQDLIRSCPEYQKLWKAAQDSAEWKVHTAKEGA